MGTILSVFQQVIRSRGAISCLVVSRRRAVLRRAGHIIVLEDGRVAGDDTFEHLLEAHPSSGACGMSRCPPIEQRISEERVTTKWAPSLDEPAEAEASKYPVFGGQMSCP